MPLNEELRHELLAMQAEDLRVRRELDAEGSLDEGYHPRMEEVHRRNASRLRALVAIHGWPTRALVGDEGSEAAWLVLQHAIGEPDLQRAYLPLLQEAATGNRIPAWQPAYLLDRIRFFEGKPQVYGTHSAWNDEGVMEPWVIEDPERVDARRQSVGLPPLPEGHQKTSTDRVSREKVMAWRRSFDAWARSAGWR